MDTPRRFACILLLLAARSSYAEDYRYDFCLSALAQFRSVALPSNAPEAVRDSDGKWLSDARGIVATNPDRSCARGKRASIIIDSFCAREQRSVTEQIIRGARVSYSDREDGIVSVDISREDYDWLVSHGMYNPKAALSEIVYYASCR